jgi:hypothetical protein
MPALKHESARASGYAREIAKELVSIGAITVEMRYARERITALAWTMPVSGAAVHFLMPARVEKVMETLTGQPLSRAVLGRSAERIAWRHLARWV